jgi:hypothetical protein
MAIATQNAQSNSFNFNVLIVRLRFFLAHHGAACHQWEYLHSTSSMPPPKWQGMEEVAAKLETYYFAVMVRVIVVLTVVEPDFPVTVSV